MIQDNDHVHIDLIVPAWIADILIAKVDEESMRMHKEAIDNGEVDEVLPGGKIRHSRTRKLANQLGAVKNDIIDDLRSSRGFKPGGVSMNTDQRHSDGASNSTSSSGGASATIQDRAGLYVAVVALILATLCLGILITMGPLIDAKVQAGSAQAETTAREARTTAKVNEDKLVELRDHLNSKGMNIPKLDGH